MVEERSHRGGLSGVGTSTRAFVSGCHVGRQWWTLTGGLAWGDRSFFVRCCSQEYRSPILRFWGIVGLAPLAVVFLGCTSSAPDLAGGPNDTAADTGRSGGTALFSFVLHVDPAPDSDRETRGERLEEFLVELALRNQGLPTDPERSARG